jgi:hypothetical protein
MAKNSLTSQYIDDQLNTGAMNRVQMVGVVLILDVICTLE